MKQKKKQPKVAIIIVTYNPDIKLLKECLNSIKKITDYKNYKVIISDNGSHNGVPELIKKKFKWVDLLENNANIYWAGGNNMGIKYALKKYNPDYYFLLNDDTKTIQKDWLKKMVETAESNEKIGIVGCKLIYPDGSLQHLGGYMKGPFMTTGKESKKQVVEVDHVMGSALMIKKEVISKIGLIDEIFIPYLLDETDYCLRAKKAGFKVISDRRVKIIHYKGLTINKYKEITRNCVRMKNDSLFSLINLKLYFALLRILFYLPIVMILKKKNEKRPASFKNIIFRGKIFANFLNIIKGYYYILIHLKFIYEKRRERKLNRKIWY